MNKEFADFQKHFRYYQQLFGLNGYKIYFKHEPLVDRFAQISTGNQNATVSLNSKLAEGSKPFRDIKGDAKHEAIHLLLDRFSCNAKWRYASKDEIEESEEELVVKLENLIS